ncbi:hypothetical protein F4777DRAFT_594077 [Nemania sp. FL0916]|nr:hypothetical protein F4777DRAFT_594077 [Nemania sp. FL0916]
MEGEKFDVERDAFLPKEAVRNAQLLTQSGKPKLLRLVIVLLLCGNIAQYLAIRTLRQNVESLSGKTDPWYLTYSPVQDIVEYEVREFTAGFREYNTKYMHNGSEPTDELDRAWADLYENWGFVAIAEDQAAQLTEKTAPIPGNPGHYLVGLDVFHQLHCLDNIRKAFWPDRYMKDDVHGDRSGLHLDHCIDSLRQSLMCSSDISTLHFDWLPEKHKNFVVSSATHTCRNFEKLRVWAMNKNVKGWDPGAFIPDPFRNVSEFPE